MPNLPEVSNFDPVYELQRVDSVDAGIAGNGISNTQAINLTNRTKWLKDQLAALQGGTLTGATQPIFDGTTKFATDQFVQQNKGSYFFTVRINATINPLEIFSAGWVAIANSLFISDNLPNGSQSITLQSLAAVPPGIAVHFKNEDLNYSIALIANGTELFVSPSNLDSGNTGQNSITLTPGCDITIVRSAQDSILGTGTPHWNVIVHQGNLHQWISVAGGVGFQNSWANVGTFYNGVRFRKTYGNKVELSGSMIGGTNGSVAFTLPSNFRPNKASLYSVVGLNSGTKVLGNILMDSSTGNIQTDTTSGASINLDGILISLD